MVLGRWLGVGGRGDRLSLQTAVVKIVAVALLLTLNIVDNHRLNRGVFNPKTEEIVQWSCLAITAKLTQKQFIMAKKWLLPKPLPWPLLFSSSSLCALCASAVHFKGGNRTGFRIKFIGKLGKHKANLSLNLIRFKLLKLLGQNLAFSNFSNTWRFPTYQGRSHFKSLFPSN